MAPLYCWQCTFYGKLGKWVSGELHLYRKGLKYEMKKIPSKEEGNEKSSFLISIEEVIAVKKMTSSLIYPAIVIKSSSTDYWFCSFQNRNLTFSIIDHFWKSRLLLSSSSNSVEQSKLLNLAHNAQANLAEAAVTLNHQGQQIRSAQNKMNKLHGDLDVANNLISGLESWTGTISSSNTSTKDKSEIGTSAQGTVRLEYPILFARMSQETHNNGLIVLRDSTIEILYENSVSHFTFATCSIEVVVHSPVDTTLYQRIIGEKDTQVHIKSSSLTPLLRAMLKLYKDKVVLPDFLDIEPEDDEWFDDEKMHEMETDRSNLFDFNGENKKVVKSAQNISDSDANELSLVVNNLKSLATNISAEQDAQLINIENLTQSVESGNQEILKSNKRIKKLL